MNFTPCCEIFLELFKEPGRKGYSILPTKVTDPDVYYFVLQFRSADFEDNTKNVSAGQRAIKYCPWCGRQLSEIIDLNKTEIIHSEQKTRHLLI